MTDPVTPKNKSIPREVPPTPAVGEAVVKLLRGMSKLLEDFHDDPVQHAHCIRLFRIYLDILKEKSEEGVDEASGAKIVAAMDTMTVSDYGLEHAGNWHNGAEVAGELLRQEPGHGLVGNLRRFDPGKYKEVEESVKSLRTPVITTSSTGKVLLPITYGLTEAYSVEHITEARDDFFAAIREVQFTVIRDNKAESIDISNEKAVNITNFFFYYTMGKPALQRLSSLVSSCNKKDTDGDNRAVAERADVAAENTENPELKKLFKTMGNVVRSLGSSNSITHQIYVNHMHMELAAVYSELMAEVTEKKASTRQRALNEALGNELSRKGFKTKKGKGLKTAVIDYICHELIIDRNALDNRIQGGKALRLLVEHFGAGIIIVIPGNGMTVLQRFGAQVMARVYPILLKKAQFVLELSNIIGRTVYQPMVFGQPLRIQEIKITGKVRLITLLKDADEAKSADEMEVDL